MDADLQDDVDAAGTMVDKYLAGADIVYGVRSSRKTDTFFKRTDVKGIAAHGRDLQKLWAFSSGI